MIDDKKYDEIDQISKIDIDRIEKESEEIYQIDMIDDKKYDERDQISKSDIYNIEK